MTPANIALVFDASPSIYRELAQMRDAARHFAASLRSQDEVAVVAFSKETHLLMPFSSDRSLLDAALASPALAQVANSAESRVYQAVYLTARQLFRDVAGRKAIVLLTDGQDSGLGLTVDPKSMEPRARANALAFVDVARELAANGIVLYVISTENRPRAMTPEWLAAHQREPMVTAEARGLGMPHYTLYLAELVRHAGGGLYFLRETQSLQKIYDQIAVAIGAEYAIGYYPSAGIANPGWRSITLQLRAAANAPAGARLSHRPAYYVSALTE
jgi:VWFA-related protein